MGCAVLSECRLEYICIAIVLLCHGWNFRPYTKHKIL